MLDTNKLPPSSVGFGRKQSGSNIYQATSDFAANKFLTSEERRLLVQEPSIMAQERVVEPDQDGLKNSNERSERRENLDESEKIR